MKLKSDRYVEAVERNLGNAERRVRADSGHKYHGEAFSHAKTMLGIRKDDEAFDHRVLALIS
jgi:hypothetical protein